MRDRDGSSASFFVRLIRVPIEYVLAWSQVAQLPTNV